MKRSKDLRQTRSACTKVTTFCYLCDGQATPLPQSLLWGPGPNAATVHVIHGISSGIQNELRLLDGVGGSTHVHTGWFRKLPPLGTGDVRPRETRRCQQEPSITGSDPGMLQYSVFYASLLLVLGLRSLDRSSTPVRKSTRGTGTRGCHSTRSLQTSTVSD